MASSNPDLSAHLKLPSPKAADPPDVPGDIKALADAVDTAIQTGRVTVSFANNEQKDSPVTFSPAFSGTPRVVATVSNSTFLYASVSNVSNGSADIGARDSRGAYTGSINIEWVAIGPA